MVFRVIRYRYSIDDRFTSIIFILNIQVRIRKHPANLIKSFNFVRELLRDKASKCKVMFG